MIITNNAKNTMPEQVQENADNIKILAEHIKEVYHATIDMTTSTSDIDISVTDIPTGVTSGFILSRNGNFYKIVTIEQSTVYVRYWSSLPAGPQGPQGPQGPRGEAGPQGPAGELDVQAIDLSVGTPTVTYDSSTGITVSGQGEITTEGEEPKNISTEFEVPIVAGHGVSMDAGEDQDVIVVSADTGRAVTIIVLGSATSGTLTEEQLALLQSSNNNFIMFNNKIFKLTDKQTASGYLVYSHTGEDSTHNFYVKCITVTISTRGWVLTTKEVGGGGSGAKMYQHNICIRKCENNATIVYFSIITEDSTDYTSLNQLKTVLLNKIGDITSTVLHYIPAIGMINTRANPSAYYLVKAVGATSAVNQTLYLQYIESIPETSIDFKTVEINEAPKALSVTDEIIEI